jgi:rod shape-determining protein MreD
MNIDIIKAITGALILLAAQVLVLNNIHLFGCATPLLLVYIIIIMPADTPRWVSLLCGFFMGLVSDIFSNTPGVAAASLTAVAFIQPMLLQLFLSREAPESLSPSMKSLGTAKFISFSLIQVLLFCLLFFTLEEFNFFRLTQWALFIGGSTLLTFLLLLTIENFRKV